MSEVVGERSGNGQSAIQVSPFFHYGVSAVTLQWPTFLCSSMFLLIRE